MYDTELMSTGYVAGYLKVMLRLEAAIVFLVAIFVYFHLGYTWKTFFVLFLFPDISFVGYIFGSKYGSIVYNVFHSYILPCILGGLSLYNALPELQCLSLIWIAHIGFDRTLGYGLKYSTSFNDTHLGPLKIFKKMF